jgi:hypothetical protein
MREKTFGTTPGKGIDREPPGLQRLAEDLLQIGASAYFRIYLTFHVRGHRDE